MKSFIVLGLGRFGFSLSKTLIELGHEVLAADIDSKIVKQYAEELTNVVEADVANEDFLKSMGVNKFDAAIVAVGSNIQVSIMTTVILKELGAQYILAKAQSNFHAKVLHKIGANAVILPEKDMGEKVAHRLVTSNFFDMMEISKDYSVINIFAPESWIGKPLADLAIRTRHGINILAVKRSEDGNVVFPENETIIAERDIITVMGKNVDLRKIEETT